MAELSTPLHPAMFRPEPNATADPSAEGMSLIGEIIAAIDAASTPEDLAGALNGILDRTAVLSADDADAVAAMASVTQSSFEYWDANYDAVGYEFAAEIAAEHPECIVGGTVSPCYVDERALPNEMRRGSPYFFASASHAMGCPRDLKFSGGQIIKTDALAGLHGAIYGGWATVGLSIVGSAVVASTGAMAWNVAVDLYCWLK